MQTYWDFTQRERADMSREMVERYLDAELMTKGVIKVKQPDLEPEPDEPKLATNTYFAIEYHKGYRQKTCIAFASAELAQKFLDLNPLCTETTYIKNRSMEYVMPMADKAIVPVELAGEQDVLNNKSLIEKVNAVRSLNDQRRSEYIKQSAAMEKVLNGVWDDWASCREFQERHKKVIDTYEEYKRMAGSEVMAAQFLGKAFSEHEIADAFEWFEIPVPTINAPEALAV